MSDEHRLRLNLTDKTDLWRRVDHAALPSLNIYYTWDNIKNFYQNKKFEILGTTLDEELELIHTTYSISGIHDYYSLRNTITDS